MKKLAILYHYCYFTISRRLIRTRPQLTRHQKKLLGRLRKRVANHSPFYTKLWVGEGLAALPVPKMDKKKMMRHFSELNTAGVTLEEALKVALEAESSRDFSPRIRGYSVGLSSGTSGNRGVFMIDDSEIREYAGNLISKIFSPGRLIGRHRIALFLRANSNLYSETGGSFFKFRFFDLLDPIASLVQKLDEFKPTVIVGPPSMLRKIAEAVEAGLRLDPKRIYSVAEVLDDFDREYLERIFGRKILQIYQATEGFLGISCDLGTLHLNEDVIVFEKEWIAGRERAFHPIITDLRRRTQPILRYRLDDILIARASPCPCGSPFQALDRIEGRSDDLFYVQSSVGAWTPVFPDFVRRAVLLSSDKIQDYRVVQNSAKELQMQIRCFDSDQVLIAQKIESQFAHLFGHYGSEKPEISYQWSIADLGLRKLRRVERRFEVPLESSREGGGKR